MLLRLAYRTVTEVSPWCLLKAAHLWVWKGLRAVRAYRSRLAKGKLFPPFLFLALTDACNLRCNGCWVHTRSAPRNLPLDDIHRLIEAGKQQKAYFYTLLGGEPMIYPRLWEIIESHRECYFQIITNGMFLDEANVARIRRLGNVTPLVSIDGFAAENDARRGEGTFAAAVEGVERLHKAKVLFGVATTVTGRNLDEVTADDYVRYFVDRGAMYLWYYAFRPMGPNPSLEFCMDREKTLTLRRRLLALRRKHPIILIDTYWNAAGEAVCPASLGLGFHIGPGGSIEPCPPLSFACETIRDHEGDLFRTIDGSRFLRDFQRFVTDRTRGCVILEHPRELAQFIRESGASDYSGRDALAELAASEPRASHHLPGEEIPEDYWVYRFLKRQLFFGMSGYG
ncbi:MAG: radical SAM protein [Patescibacteria group bacterium]|nr:radical SAM protein [Patescibacteria group bacterium]